VSRALLLLENCAHKNGHSPPEPALVKMIIVSIKWRKRCVFPYLCVCGCGYTTGSRTTMTTWTRQMTSWRAEEVRKRHFCAILY
jgi:hypothetical protein